MAQSNQHLQRRLKMSKTWTITQEHTVVTKFVVEGATEDEAIQNWHDE